MLSLMSRRPRAVGLVAEVLSAANPTFGYRGQYAGQNAVRVTIPTGIWNLRITYDGTEPFRVFNAADNSVLADQTTSVDRLFNLDKPLEFYISVNNWTTQVGRKFIVTLEEAPPPNSLIILSAACLRRCWHELKENRPHATSRHRVYSHPLRAVGTATPIRIDGENDHPAGPVQADRVNESRRAWGMDLVEYGRHRQAFVHPNRAAEYHGVLPSRVALAGGVA